MIYQLHRSCIQHCRNTNTNTGLSCRPPARILKTNGIHHFFFGASEAVIEAAVLQHHTVRVMRSHDLQGNGIFFYLLSRIVRNEQAIQLYYGISVFDHFWCSVQGNKKIFVFPLFKISKTPGIILPE